MQEMGLVADLREDFQLSMGLTGPRVLTVEIVSKFPLHLDEESCADCFEFKSG